MSDRRATVEQIIAVDEHPDADRLELVNVLGYQCVARKVQFTAGEPVVYIPEQTLVPEYLLRYIGLWDDEKGKGKLAGSEGNRVKAVKLRGKTSLGLLVPFGIHGTIMNHDGLPLRVEDTYVGEDVSDFLGVTKWEPPIPVNMAGEVFNALGNTVPFDVDNIKNFPEVLESKEFLETEYVVTEKLHGTWTCFGFCRDFISPEAPYGKAIVTSKGLSSKGLAFKDNDANANNLYLKRFKSLFPDDANNTYNNAWRMMNRIIPHAKNIYLLGEIYGKGIQDLTYDSAPQFGLFDVIYTTDENTRDFHHASFHEITLILGATQTLNENIKQVPILHIGTLTKQKILELTNGTSTLDDNTIREGVVLRPVSGFVGWRGNLYKSISDDYLNRKNATEYN